MLFGFGLYSSILLFFFLHGVVFSLLLLFNGIESENRSNIWLSAFTLLCSLYIAPFMLGYAGWYSVEKYRNILFYVPFQQLLFFPPLLYFYFRTLLDKSFVFSKLDYLNFLPAILYLVYSLIIFLVDKVFLDEVYFYADGKDKDFSSWYQITGLISLIFYLIKSLKIYNQYKTLIYDNVSFADSIIFKWAQRFLIAFLLLIAIRILFFIINPKWAQFGRKFWYYLCFSSLFYYISIIGYKNSMASIISFKDLSWDNKPESKESEPSKNENQVLNSEHKDSIEETPIMDDLDVWKEKLERLMVIDKVYENPEITLIDVCKKLDTHSKKVSQIVNLGFNMNFNDFINHYRTQALIKKIDDKEYHTKTLLSLAYECGFNSKSTFNRAFKRATSLNPNEYIKQIGLKS